MERLRVIEPLEEEPAPKAKGLALEQGATTVLIMRGKETANPPMAQDNRPKEAGKTAASCSRGGGDRGE